MPLTRQQLEAQLDAQYRRNVIRTTNWATRLTQLLYSSLDEDDLDGSFAKMLPTLTTALIIGKRQAALQAWAYMAQKATVYGVDFGHNELRYGIGKPSSTPGFDVSPWLAGADRAASGTPIATLNSRASAGVKALIKQGTSPRDALLVSQARAATLIRTEIPLVGRTVPIRAVESYSTSAFRAWRRVPGPGACAFCLSLAGRGAVYTSERSARYDKSGERYHANCRCTVQVVVDDRQKKTTAIDPSDMKAIRVRFANTGRVWERDRAANAPMYYNRPELRPPDMEFLPRSAFVAAA